MVQKEVMKKTRNYGLTGVLLAVLLIATIYSCGISPLMTPGNEISPMKTFASYEELRTFLNASSTNNGNSYWRATSEGAGQFVLSPTATEVAITSGSVPKAEDQSANDFSTTNIQVAGVDEADSVKTDGKYLYVIANNSQVVYILDANPQNAAVLSKIFLNNTYLYGVYLSADGSKLAVIGNQYVPYYVDNTFSGEYTIKSILPYWNSGTTFVYVYDVSNKAAPVLARNFTMSGNYVNSRMIGNYVYNIVTESAYLVNETVILPAVFSGLEVSTIDPTKIYYADFNESYYSYTTIVSLNIMDAAEQATNMTLMMGGAGTIFVSSSNIYVTYPETVYETIEPTATPTVTPMPSKDNSSEPLPIVVTPWYPIVRPVWQGTNIYRIQVSGASMTFAAEGNVTGNVLNQYAMDEYNGYFRIVTTAYEYDNETSWSGTQQNNVYALDMNLKVVGALEHLGTGENFHSARFIGNRLYMVTYQNTDPLFVIDMSQPSDLNLLGELIIPGYSDYLHPYDETHLIGLGKDAVVDDGINFAWYQGLKLSLFDVSDVNAPKEVAKLIIGDRGTSSEALYDPKAFLFDSSRNLLVIPVDLYLIDPNASEPQRSTATNDSSVSSKSAASLIGSGSSSSQYGSFVWQGVYIFEVSVDGGFVVKGNVTQFDNPTVLFNDPSLTIRSDYPWTDYDHFISRSLYIDDVLYTFSQSRVQLNSLADFSLIAQVDLT
jgi:uncharacterized secreted protein with C-terminal beta-propeller domain